MNVATNFSELLYYHVPLQPILLHLLEDLAEELDANPSFWNLCKKSPLFAVNAQFGPVVPALYRIVGHGALPDGIKNYKNICYRAFNTPNYQLNSDKTVSQERGAFPTRYLVFGVLIVALLWMWNLCGWRNLKSYINLKYLYFAWLYFQYGNNKIIVYSIITLLLYLKGILWDIN